MKIPTFAVAACAALLFAVPARAQEWGEVVAAQLEAVAEALGDENIREVGQPITGGLDAGETEDRTVTISAAGTYLIVGVCDQDCTDIDLELYGPGGNLIDSDVADDDVPVLVGELPSGQYRLRVKMITCEVEPCNYGVGLFTA